MCIFLILKGKFILKLYAAISHISPFVVRKLYVSKQNASCALSLCDRKFDLKNEHPRVHLPLLPARSSQCREGRGE